MDKPLKDWTLAEAQAYCKGSEDCEDCPMRGDDWCSCRTHNPANWDLFERSKYTADEITLAQLLVKAGVETVRRKADKDELLLDWSDCRSRLPGAAFPSLEPNRTVELEAIAESEAQDG